MIFPGSSCYFWRTAPQTRDDFFSGHFVLKNRSAEGGVHRFFSNKLVNFAKIFVVIGSLKRAFSGTFVLFLTHPGLHSRMIFFGGRSFFFLPFRTFYVYLVIFLGSSYFFWRTRPQTRDDFFSGCLVIKKGGARRGNLG